LYKNTEPLQIEKPANVYFYFWIWTHCITFAGK